MTTETPYPLGRLVNHDERSRAHPVSRYLAARALVSVTWKRRVPVYDQGGLGSCTAQAICGAVSTQPWAHAFRSQRTVTAVYREATVIDPWDGAWPPDDTGSDGLSVCKVAQRRGWIAAYAHAFSFGDVLQALQYGPVITGVPWHDGMFDTTDGLVRVSGPTVGGHEVCLVGVDMQARQVRFANSWGPGWGSAGFGLLGFDDYAALLADYGDATVPLAVIPTPPI